MRKHLLKILPFSTDFLPGDKVTLSLMLLLGLLSILLGVVYSDWVLLVSGSFSLLVYGLAISVFRKRIYGRHED